MIKGETNLGGYQTTLVLKIPRRRRRRETQGGKSEWLAFQRGALSQEDEF